MKTNKKEIDFLEILITKCQITEKNLADYANEKHDDLMNIENIFNLKSEDDFCCCLTIPLLLDPLAAQEIIAYFKDEERDNPFVKTAQPDIDKYKLLLVSAFVFHPSFFAMAWNWCALIRQELQLQMLNNQNERKIVQFNAITSLPKNKLTVIKLKDQLQAASGTDSILEVGDWKVDDKDVYFGRLWIKVTSGEARFLFMFANYNEHPPCNLSLKCKTKDGKEYSNIILKDIESGNEELIIRSEIITNFDYSDVEILELECIING